LSQRGYEAEYRLSLQRAAEAERLYLEALRRNPRDLEALYGLGCVYALTGDFRRAVEIWSRCIETRPDWGEVHIALAWAYYRLGDRDRGFRFVESALKLGVRIKSERELLTRFREMAEKPLINLILEEEEPKEHLIFNKTAILGLIFVFFFALYAYSSVLYGFPKGGDAPNALSMIRYLEKWWPHFPRWNTEWGCGYPFLTFYPPLGIVSTFLLSKALSLPIFMAYKIVMLLVVVASSIGLYLLSLSIFEDATAALATAVLYLSTPGSFNNLIYWGFYTEHFAYPLLIASMLLLHLSFKTSKKRFLTASIALYALVLISHALIAVLGTIVLFTYILWLHIMNNASLSRFIKNSFLFFGFGLALVAFWYLPSIFLGGLSQYRIASPFSWPPLSLEQLIGLPGSGFTRLAPWTVGLACLGVVASLRMRRVGLFFTLWSAILVFYLEALHLPQLAPIYGRVVFPQRFLPWAALFLSILGGVAVKDFNGRFGGRTPWAAFVVAFLLSSPLAVIQRAEVEGADSHQLDYEMVRILGELVDGRIAISPRLGGVLQTFNLASNQSQLDNYQLQSAPNLMWIGIAKSYLFEGFGDVEDVSLILRWFGVRYLLLKEETDPLSLYRANSLFEEVWRRNGVNLVKFREATPYASIGDKRRILVIGDIHAYENTFLTLLLAGFDPESGALVWSGRRVEEHDLRELFEFDIVILYGYSYRDMEEAFRLLEEYVEGGGALLVDTGYSPDSESEDLPPPIPIIRTMAGDFGFTWRFSTSDSSITADTNFSAFPPPRYGEAPWGVSYTFNVTLQPWAETLVWLNGHPIVVAGEYGGGRVVWCGLNLPYHAKSYRNREEARLLLRLLDRLSPPKGGSSLQVEVERPIPEKIIVNIDEDVKGGASIYLRETYFHKWHAYLEADGERRELRVYYSGPGFMLVITPEDLKSPARIIFRYRTTKIEYVGGFISLVALALLIIYAAKRRVAP